LEVRMPSAPDAVAPATRFDFEILPPWPRTKFAYAAYGLGLVGVLLGMVRWTSQRERQRTAELEKIVRERTSQLNSTMAKLNEETRNAATLAERHRLAGEIHDSLQQGLSGLMLQLDATLKLPAISPDVRTRLDVARNMVSFTRHEVQHAVWDMESPLLENAELHDALRNLTVLIGAGTVPIDNIVKGSPILLPASTKHHLLRIAQEALTNAVRHSSAGRIRLELIYDDQKISLTVADDGIGFPAEDVVARSVGHFSLRGMRSRAKSIEGNLSIESWPNKGTAIRVSLPLAQKIVSRNALVHVT
jgi:signal transduction histidine kinase